MKTKIITATIILLCAVESFAQDATLNNMQTTVNNLYTEIWAQQTTNLNLTAIQVSQWQALDAADLKQADAIISNTTLTNDQKQTQLNTLAAQQQAQLKQILKAAQYAKWSAEKTAVKSAATTTTDTLQSKAVGRLVRAGGRRG